MKKETWVDSVKIFSCILVVLGHFLQSMNTSGIFDESNIIIDWFLDTIYLFHVPLFFICSGYLYEKYGYHSAGNGRMIFILKKFISLGVPYFSFSIITWLIRYIFSSSVNHQNDGLLYSLFCEPISPYWYLYALFFIFLLIPNCKTKKCVFIIFTVAAVIRILLPCFHVSEIYALNIIISNCVWFVLGMFIHIFDLVKAFKKSKFLKYPALIIFWVLSIIIFVYKINTETILLTAGITGCITVLLFFACCENNCYIAKFTNCFSKYTLPVYLMHTIFAAGVRIVLLKLGIENSLIHILCGLTATFAGPVIATLIMSKIKYSDFILYPLKYVRIKSMRLCNVKKT